MIGGIDKFIHEFNILPEIHLILGFKKLIDYTNFLIDKKILVEMGYDTTFNCGPYYVSFLCTKALTFNETPLFPICALIHQTRKLDVHQKFLNFVKLKLNLDAENCVFVIDRESSIKRAFEDKLVENPDLFSLVFCTNHILNNVKFWCRKTQKKFEIKVKNQPIDKLDQLNNSLSSNESSEHSFNEKEEESVIESVIESDSFNKIEEESALVSDSFDKIEEEETVESLDESNLKLPKLKKKKKRKSTACKVLHNRSKRKTSSNPSTTKPKDSKLSSISKNSKLVEEIKSMEDCFDFSEGEESEEEIEKKNSKDIKKTIINNNRIVLFQFYKDIKDLIETKDKLVHSNKAGKLRNNWNKKCLNYFDTFLYKDLRSNLGNIKNTEKSNICECINSIFKSFINHEYLQLDELLVSIFKFMANFWEEFDRSSDLVGGNYSLKEIYKEKKFEFDFPYSKIRIKDEIQNLKNQFKDGQKISTKVKSQQQLADLAIANGKYSFDKDEKRFRVTSPMSDLTYFVDLVNGKPVCKCPFKGRCFHEIVIINLLNLNDGKKIEENFRDLNLNKIHQELNLRKLNSKKSAEEKLGPSLSDELMTNQLEEFFFKYLTITKFEKKSSILLISSDIFSIDYQMKIFISNRIHHSIDLIFSIINTDLKGPGFHWVLGKKIIANL